MTDSCKKKLPPSVRLQAICRQFSCVVQDLRELTQDHALSMDVKHDVAANSSDLSTAYTVTSNTDLQNYLGLTYACSVPSNSTLNAAVQACASLNSRTCCVEDSSLSLTKVKLRSLKQACARALLLRHDAFKL